MLGVSADILGQIRSLALGWLWKCVEIREREAERQAHPDTKHPLFTPP